MEYIYYGDFPNNIIWETEKIFPSQTVMTHAQSKFILNLCVKWNKGINFTLWPSYSMGRVSPPHYSFSQRLRKVQGQAKSFGDKESFPCRK